jgi:hypothetical protein
MKIQYINLDKNKQTDEKQKSKSYKIQILDKSVQE